MEVVEPILTSEGAERFIIFPIKHEAIWKMYKKHQAHFWTAEEVKLAGDVRDWELKLTKDERWFIENILGFFVAADGMVQENLAERFQTEIQIPEARLFYGWQIAMEGIHQETYGLLIETYVKDMVRKEEIRRACIESPHIKAKGEFIAKWTRSESSFGERLVAFAAVEGILFSSSFCALFWLKKRGLMRGLSFSNELIARDEGIHVDFSVLVFSMLVNKPRNSVVKEIIASSVDIEQKFVAEALKCDLIGMNSKMMCEYVEFVADRLSNELIGEKIYNTKNPFPWMELISLQGKTNFFEKSVGEYSKSGVADLHETDRYNWKGK